MLHALPSYLSESLIVIIKCTAINEIKIQGCDGCETLFDSKLKTGSEIDADDSRVHLATILTSGGEPIEPRWYYMSLMIMVTVLNLHHFILPLWSRYVFHLDHMLSTLLNSSPNTSTNLIIITDSLRPKKARQIITGLVSKLSIMEPLLFQMISNTIGKFLSEKVIREKFGSIQSNEVTTFMMSEEFQKRKSESLPDLKVEFLDVNSIFSKYKATIQGMKKYFGPNNKTVWIPPGDLRYIKCT